MILKKNLNNKQMKKGKNEIFDDFILDLFSNQYSLGFDNHTLSKYDNDSTKNESMLPLDQSLLISTAKK